MRLLLIDNGTSFLDLIRQRVADHEVCVRPRGHLQDLPTCDAIILSGGHQTPIMGHDDLYAPEIELVRTTERPLFGICLGFELIAHALGATIERLPTKEYGDVTIEAVAHEPLFRDVGNCVFESHRWAVRALPPTLLPLAHSTDGIEAFRHSSRPIYAVQFHPEKTDPNQRTVLDNFLEIAAARMAKK